MLVPAVLADFEQTSGDRGRIAAVLRRYTPMASVSSTKAGPIYNATLHAVRFWRHDGAIEASFYVNEDALKRIQPELRPDEAGILDAFDANRIVTHMLLRRLIGEPAKALTGCLLPTSDPPLYRQKPGEPGMPNLTGGVRRDVTQRPQHRQRRAVSP